MKRRIIKLAPQVPAWCDAKNNIYLSKNGRKQKELKEDIAKTENKEQRLHYSTALKKIENQLSYRADEYKEIIRTYNELIKTDDIENTVFKFLAREGNGPYQYYFIRSNNIKSAREKLLNTFNSIVHIEDEEVLSSIEANRLIKNGIINISF